MRHLIAVCLLGAPTAALACSLTPQLRWEQDPAEVLVDETAPGAVAVEVRTIKRGQGERGGGSTSCDDLGWIELTFSAEDDRTAAEKLGLELELVDGALPDGLELPAEPWVAGPEGTVTLSWIDGASDDQEPIDVRVRARAVDAAGNRGPWSDVRLKDDGSEGCSTSGGAAPLATLALLAILRRRR